jgi:hypothetical protein
MAQEERQPGLLNECAAVVLLTRPCRCKIGPREQASVGSGDHCARIFNMRSDRPTDAHGQEHEPLLKVRGGLCSLPPSQRATAKGRNTYPNKGATLPAVPESALPHLNTKPTPRCRTWKRGASPRQGWYPMEAHTGHGPAGNGALLC